MEEKNELKYSTLRISKDLKSKIDLARKNKTIDSFLYDLMKRKVSLSDSNLNERLLENQQKILEKFDKLENQNIIKEEKSVALDILDEFRKVSLELSKTTLYSEICSKNNLPGSDLRPVSIACKFMAEKFNDEWNTINEKYKK